MWTRGKSGLDFQNHVVACIRECYCSQGGEGTEPTVKKTRGRRKKSDIDEESKIDGEESKTPTRRGRKKKATQVEADATNAELVEEDQAQIEELGEDDSVSAPAVKKRGRGRPRKTLV